MSRYKVRRQRPVRGGREYMGAGFIREIEREVERTAAQFRVSRSFVIAVAVADAFGIDEQERFTPRPKSGKVVPIGRRAS